MYVPNPSCRDFAKYEWIGQLMGAALRGKEFLVSSPVIILSAEPGPQTQEAQCEDSLGCHSGTGPAWVRVEAAVW